jgi:hypothetical protein
MVALFWSYTNSIMNLEEAKGAYGLILSIAQLGAISGSTLAANASSVGISLLFLVGAMHVFAVSLMIKVYNIVYREQDAHVSNRVRSISEAGEDSDEEDEQEKEMEIMRRNRIRQDSAQGGDGGGGGNSGGVLSELDAASSSGGGYLTLCLLHLKIAGQTVLASLAWINRGFSGFYEGLILILQHRYTLKLLGVSVLFEIVVTVLDYEFKLMGAHSVEHYTEHLLLDAVKEGMDTHYSAEERFANLLGRFGQLTNSLSLFVALFGFSYLLQRLSVQVALLIFPTILFISVVLSNLVPTLSVMFALLTVLKALIFSLNEPVKELLYQPTSDAIKFKAKAWIDVFGCRLAKAVGSLITGYSAGDVRTLRAISEIPCLLLAVAIIALSWSIGNDFNELIDGNLIVGAHGIHHHVHPRGSGSGDRSYSNSVYGDGELLVRNGLRPGDVGYDGYDLKLFEGVFDEDEQQRMDSDRQEAKL